MEVYGTGNNMIYSIEKVLYKWKQKFMSLYNVIPPIRFRRTYTNDKTINYLYELNRKDPLHSSVIWTMKYILLRLKEQLILLNLVKSR